MSTHFHLVLSVEPENVSDFMQSLDPRLAKAIQVLRRYVRGVVWASGKLSLVELVMPEAVVEGHRVRHRQSSRVRRSVLHE
jgi:hypothetical protein